MGPHKKKPAVWVAPLSRFRDLLPVEALANHTTSRLGVHSI